MGKSSRKIVMTDPASFSLVLLKGESLVYRGGSITPKSKSYLVTGTATRLDRNVLRQWFLDNIVPLVGQDAMKELEKLLANTQNRHVSNFLDKALQHQKQLK